MFGFCYLIVTSLILAALVIICWRNHILINIRAAADYEDLDVIYSHDEDFVPEDDEIDLDRI